MLKVLIADDEEKVCALIAHLVKWEELGFQIAGIVHDGMTAYEFVSNHQVDVMITDIRMPELDGLELIEKVRQQNAGIHIVIISGYSQFDYAQNAIKFGVEDYLLKPLRKKDLTATLHKILLKYEKMLSQKEEKEVLEQRISKEEQKVKQNFLGELINHPEKFYENLSKDQVNEEYYYAFADETYQAAVIHPMLPREGDTIQSRQVLLNRALRIVDENLDGCCTEYVSTLSRGSIYCIFNGDARQMELVYRRLKKIKLEIVRLQDVFCDIKVYISLGIVTREFHSIFESIHSAREGLYQRFCQTNGAFLKAEEKQDNHVTLEEVLNNQFRKNFLSQIETLDIEQIQVDFKRLEDRILTISLTDGKFIYELYKEILELFYFSTNNYGIQVSNQYHELIGRFHSYDSITQVFEALLGYVTEALSAWKNQKKLAESKPVRLAKQFIQEHYYEPLTLELVSAQIGFHPTYFSSLFKKETDRNFSEYLIDVRIEHAKESLLSSNDTIINIAEAVGYSDIKHFSKLFKKITGLSPTEFRKLYN